MPAPVINPTTSILSYRVGEHWFYNPAASNTPTSWAITPLPPGLSFTTATGRIAGAVTEQGVAVAILSAINASGVGTLDLCMGIENVDYVEDASIEVDVDILTGRVTGVDEAVEKALNGKVQLYGKCGDTIILSVGFKKKGVLQDVYLGLLDLGLTEFADEGQILLSDGFCRKIGYGNTARYQIFVTLQRSKLKPYLDEYEDSKLTYFLALAELRWRVAVFREDGEEPIEVEQSSRTFTMQIEKDQNADIDPS